MLADAPLHLGLATASLDVVVEPGDGLQESLLLGVLLPRVREVRPDGEAMLHVRVQVDLVLYLELLQDVLALATLLGREDRVRFWSRLSNAGRVSGGCFPVFLRRKGVDEEAVTYQTQRCSAGLGWPSTHPPVRNSDAPYTPHPVFPPSDS